MGTVAAVGVLHRLLVLVVGEEADTNHGDEQTWSEKQEAAMVREDEEEEVEELSDAPAKLTGVSSSPNAHEAMLIVVTSLNTPATLRGTIPAR